MKTIECGTLVVAVVRPEGIYLAADSRRTGQRDDVNKLFQVGPHTIGAIRGRAMLNDDANPANDRMFARHFVNLVNEPLPLSRPAKKSDGYLADTWTKGKIEAALQGQLAHVEQDWHDDDLTPETHDLLAKGPVMFGLTIAQSEADGWLLLIDLTCQMTSENGRIRAEFGETSTDLLYNGPYKADLFKPFRCDECEVHLPDQNATSDDVASVIDQYFATTIKSSTKCAEHVGGPIDIALTTGGAVRVVRHKPQPAPYFDRS